MTTWTRVLVPLTALMSALGCASSPDAPATWEESGSSNDVQRLEDMTNGDRPQEFFDKKAAGELSFASCTSRVNELLPKDEAASIKTLIGCMKRVDYVDTALLKEEPYNAAIVQNEELTPLVLKMLARRDEDLHAELEALRLPIASAREAVREPEKFKDQRVVIRGRVNKQWEKDGVYYAGIAERADAANLNISGGVYEKRQAYDYRSGQSYEYTYKREASVDVKGDGYGSGNAYGAKSRRTQVVETGFVAIVKMPTNKRIRPDKEFIVMARMLPDLTDEEQSFKLKDLDKRLIIEIDGATGDKSDLQLEVAEGEDGADGLAMSVVPPETHILEAEAIIAR